MRRFRLGGRFATVGMASFNAGAGDWAGLLGCLAVWACIEAGIAWHLREERRRRERWVAWARGDRVRAPSSRDTRETGTRP